MDNLKKPKENEIPFKCEICDKELKSKNSLKKHFIVVHNSEGEHQCKICQKDFNIKRRLTLHMKVVHENKKKP